MLIGGSVTTRQLVARAGLEIAVPYMRHVIRGLDPRIHPQTVIPGREPRAKLTKSILSLGE
jgi:hypothetical protein